MHYSLKNILSIEDVKYLIEYFKSHNRYVTQGMEKLAIPFDDMEFMSVIDNILQNKLNIKEKYKIIGDNYYKHSESYFPHCDATDENAWLNIVIPLERYRIVGDQKFIVFNQKWAGANITWTGNRKIAGDFASNKKTNQRPADSEFFLNGTDKELPDELWDHIDQKHFSKEYLHNMDGVAYDWTPGDIIVFESQHIHATGKMQSSLKLGLSIRVEKI